MVCAARAVLVAPVALALYSPRGPHACSRWLQTASRGSPLAARQPEVKHKIPIIADEHIDPHSDPSRPRWLYRPEKVPNASDWHAVLDARSPGEFAEDRIPGAWSTPVLDDAERAEVGTEYAASPFSARVRGASLVAARLSEILADPKVAALPRDAKILVYCWRGGDRSGSLAHALSRVGWHVALLEGGYKAYRKRVREALYEDAAGPLLQKCVAVGGPTGSAKGKVLDALVAQGAQVVDLEGLARHRGSVLGAEPSGEAQPTQKGFESALWGALGGLDPSRPVFVELESAKIGRLDVPRPLFKRLAAAPVVEIKVPLAERVKWIRRGYAHFEDGAEGTAQLRRLLGFCEPSAGKAAVARWHAFADAGEWDAFVAAMLADHYDPQYARARSRDRENADADAAAPFELAMPTVGDDDVNAAAAAILERYEG